ncbi:MAG: hypothetical protein WEA09_08460 [Gemmatimonadota bacterium]
MARNQARGVDPDGWSASSRYKRGSDIPWEVEARVREALERQPVGVEPLNAPP